MIRRVSAVVVLTKALIWYLRRCIFMLVWRLPCPKLTRKSIFGLGLSSSVVCSISSEGLACFKRIAKVPSVIRIGRGSVAPDSLLGSEVSAVVVVTKALIWSLRWCILMLVWILASPFLTGGPTSGHALHSSVVVTVSDYSFHIN